MITVRTRRKLGIVQEQLGGDKESLFIVNLGQNLLDFIDRYAQNEDYEYSLLYSKVGQLVEDKDYKGLEKIFMTLQVFGTYDKITTRITKYKNISTAVGLTYNGTVFEGFADEKIELEKIVAKTCSMCSPEGDKLFEKHLAQIIFFHKNNKIYVFIDIKSQKAEFTRALAVCQGSFFVLQWKIL